MRVIVCGAGQVGYGIAERLAAERNDVSVIDISPERIRAVRETLEVRGFVGHGSRPDVLEAAGAAQADMLIAATVSDEVNMVACQVAHSLFDVPVKVARIRAQTYLQSQNMDLFSRENIPIDMVISPEVEVGEMVLRRIALPGAADIVRFCENAVTMLAIECAADCPVLGTPLDELSRLFPGLDATVVAISRQGTLAAARSADRLAADDLAYVVGPDAQVARTLGLFGHAEREAQRIVIAGAGNIGLYVALAIEKRRHSTAARLIEIDAEQAETAADALRRSVVLNGSALDQKLLMEAGVQDAELMVALTDDDQVNILSGAMARRLGCKANLILLNNPAYHGFADTLGVDAYVNPRAVTVSRILQQVRRGRIRAIHSIGQGAAEIIEAEALETSPLVGRPLKELELPDGMRLGAVYREGKVLRPDGRTAIRPKDRVVVFAMADAVRQVEQMFRVSLEFF